MKSNVDNAVDSGAWIEIHGSLFGYRASANWDIKNYSVCGVATKTVLESVEELNDALEEYRNNWPPKA